MKILLAITFVYGILRFVTMLKIFDTGIVGIFDSILPFKELPKLFQVLDIWFFYFSLAFQTWFWLFQ